MVLLDVLFLSHLGTDKAYRILEDKAKENREERQAVKINNKWINRQEKR